MGRTIPSWRQGIDQELARLSRFKHTLRKEERLIFDDLLNQCRLYASAASAAALPTKTDGLFLTLLFSHHKMIHELRERIDKLRESTRPKAD
ncbi:MAG: hypothetical protein QW390_02505 [Candidatus Bathyarchaeia archaeon]